MSNIQSPVVIEIDYSSRTFDQLKETIAPKCTDPKKLDK